MKYVIAAVPYSDNLGDGVIAANLSDCIRRKNKHNIVSLCDISYRSEVASFKNKDTGMKFFLKLPRAIRQFVVVLFFSSKYFRHGGKYLKEKLVDCDELLIGGGQLISDVDFNFPLKLYFLIRIAEKFDIKTSIVSVGVAARWSCVGRLLMKRVLTSKVIMKISVRDEFSKKNLATRFGIDDAVILPDPALMCSISAGGGFLNKPSLGEEKILGLGVADINGLNYSSDIINNQDDNSIEYICSIVDMACLNEYTVYLFTNGAIEDERFLYDEIIPKLKLKGLGFKVLPRCKNINDLVDFIKNTNRIVAYRLHANIIASSFNIPYFAVGWDNKVLSYFKLQDRESYVFNSLSELSDAFDVVINDPVSISNLDAKKVESMYSDFIGLNRAD